MKLITFSDDFNTRYEYEATYNKDLFKEELAELAQYGYLAYNLGVYNVQKVAKYEGESQIKSASHLRRQAKYSFNRDYQILPDTVRYHRDCARAQYSYEYSYTKTPDLYHYVAILVDELPMNLDKEADKSKYEALLLKENIIPASADKVGSQLIWKILEYGDSKEFQMLSSMKNYDFKGLCEIYDKVLQNIELKLVKVVERKECFKVIDGETFIKSRKKEKGK